MIGSVGFLTEASHAAVLVAQSPQDALAPFLPFLNFGIIGVLVVFLATKTGFVPRWTLDQCEAKADEDAQEAEAAHQREVALLQSQIDQLKTDKAELKASNDQLTRVAQDQFLPALIEANRLTSLYVDVLSRRGSAS